MKKIKVHFLDWYDWIMPGSSQDNIFLYLLKKNFDVILDDKNPDVLFYSLYFGAHKNYNNCLKIYVNSEPMNYNDLSLYPSDSRHIVAINDSDYMFTSYQSNISKNYYMPIFLLWLYHHIKVTKIVESFESLTKYREITDKNRFCIFLHKNHNAEKRNQLLSKVTQYKQVEFRSDSISNNYCSLGKINGIKNFKFSFAMQNHYYKENKYNYVVPGLIDEKIIESLIAGTIPLYYGNENVGDYINSESIINFHDFESDERFIQKIIDIDSNNKLFEDYLRQPIIKNLEMLRLNELENFLLKIIK
jgi:hypothetical protein